MFRMGTMVGGIDLSVDESARVLQERIDTYLDAETRRRTGAEISGSLLAELAAGVTRHVGEPVIVCFAQKNGATTILGYPLSIVTGPRLDTPAQARSLASMEAASVKATEKVVTRSCYTCGKPAPPGSKGSTPNCGKCR